MPVSSPSAGEECSPGLEGCPCAQGSCAGGLQCNDYGWCVSPSCGDGLIQAGEPCEPGDPADPTSSCLSTCERPRSCLEIKQQYGADALDGDYLLYPSGPEEPPWETTCDMSTEGGGWTRITLADACGDPGAEGRFAGELSLLDSSMDAGVGWSGDPCRPVSRDLGAAWHVAYLDIPFPPGFSAFYLADFSSRANADLEQDPQATCELDPVARQTRWVWTPGEGADISFGVPAESGPRASYGAYLSEAIACGDCEVDFPRDRQRFETAPSEVLRISWGEAGLESEGWFPWWSGSIYLR